jgi:hypothetical protein
MAPNPPAAGLNQLSDQAMSSPVSRHNVTTRLMSTGTPMSWRKILSSLDLEDIDCKSGLMELFSRRTQRFVEDRELSACTWVGVDVSSNNRAPHLNVNQRFLTRSLI